MIEYILVVDYNVIGKSKFEISIGGFVDQFKLSIEVLEHGWADLCLFLNGYERLLYFERIPNDPLQELLESTFRIKDYRDSTIVFHNGSCEDKLYIKNLVCDLIRIEYEDSYLELSKKQYYKAVMRMFDKYLFNFSVEAYTSHWRLFPNEALEKLRTLYHASS